MENIIKEKLGGYMGSLEEIIEKIVGCNDEIINVKLKGLKEVMALEEELKRRGIPFVMDIRLTNIGCKATIGREKIEMYEKGVEDLRVDESKVLYDMDDAKEKHVPIGMSNYRMVKKENAYYVDKTKMIEELLRLNDQVTLITRPRRFGKTLNMSMLAEFFDITKDSKEIFKDTYIYQTKYVKEMNKWPVIFLSFFDCKGDEGFMMESLIGNLLYEYDKYSLEFDNIKSIGFKKRIERVYDILLRNVESDKELFLMQEALSLLIRFLYEKYNKQVILLLDEYDTPFMSALTGKYYEQVKDLLTGMLSSALKDNEYLYKGVLTGIQRIAKENLFSGLNNLEVCSIQDEKYKDVFGFTEDETRTLLKAHHLELNQDVKEMYDGYTIGGIEIYNPWSVLNYADKGVLASYWINTGSNEVVCQLLEKGEIKVNCILEGAYVELHGAT